MREIELPRTHAAFSKPPGYDGAARLLPPREALEPVREVYERVAAETAGMLSRSDPWWENRVLNDPEHRRQGRGELNAVVFEREGRPEAYALYRLTIAFDQGLPAGTTDVVEAVGVSPAATAAAWRFLLDVDWMDRVKAFLLPVDHPLLHLLVEPNRMRFRVGDALWLRLVDVGAALAARSYAGDGELVLEVADAFCPWNDARFALDGSKTRAEPDLRLPVAALGSAFLGGFTFAQLAAAGRVEEARAGALERADALFRTARAPWTPEIF